MRARLYFAYRHSFRSGRSVLAFVKYYRMAG